MIEKYLLKNTSIVTFSSGLGVVLGFILDACILYYFGVGGHTDALFIAWTIPLLIINTLETQSGKVLIPIIFKHLKEYGKKESDLILSNLINSTFIIFMIFSIICIVFSNGIIFIQSPGLDADTFSRSIVLSQLLFIVLPFRSIDIIFKTILYSKHYFLIPSFSRVIINLTVIICIFSLNTQLGIFAFVVGQIIGSLLSLTISFSMNLKYKFKFSFTLNYKDSELFKTYRLYIYPIFEQAFGSSRVFIENFLASFLASGSITIVRLASRIITAISGVLLGSVVTTLMPLISEYSSTSNDREMKNSIISGIKFLLLIAIPASLFFIFSGKDFITLLYVRGEFKPEYAVITGYILALLSPLVIFSRISGILQTVFYSKLNMLIPLICSIISILSNAIVTLSLLSFLEIYSFPIGASAGSLLSLIYIVVMFNKKFGSLGWAGIKQFYFKITLTIITSSIFFIIGLKINQLFLNDIIFKNVVSLIVPAILGAISYIVFINFIGIIDLRSMINLVLKRKIKKPIL